ncbi:MAG TPA: ABC transporter substrate-binding protein [Ktedonobacterales bacterium]|jgi:iron complex transport system substrate-binding protein
MRTGTRPLAALALVAGLLAVLLAGCGGAATASGPEKPLIATDTLGTTITIPKTAPQKIISLEASDSEILAALGATDRVIGVDTYTDYPAAMAAKPKVADQNGLPIVEQIVALKPDLVLGYGGEVGQYERQLLQAHLNVVDLPATDLNGSLNEMLLVGQLIHADAAARTLVNSLRARIAAVQNKVKGQPTVTVYMEADDSNPSAPYVFGGGSFGNDVITDAGGTNIFGGDATNSGYPTESAEAIIKDNPAVIILTEDPRYGGDPSKVAQRPGWSTIDAVKNGQVYQLNSDLFQRPGPRVVDGLEQLAKLLHPAQFA